MECQEHSYKAEGKYTSITLPLKGSFLNAYKRKCAVVRELTTHLDMAAHTYNPWHLRAKVRELLVGGTGWKTLTSNEQNVDRKKSHHPTFTIETLTDSSLHITIPYQPQTGRQRYTGVSDLFILTSI